MKNDIREDVLFRFRREFEMRTSEMASAISKVLRLAYLR